ncbi:hypothetical protein [Butyrivibrio sp. AE3004]|uniref:hypothetical protein n=1 Tax=Butyrivibrio sp. AE3004 TaxID=1506994 RepID=UPI0004948D40|nr:hypothetical protein [Butyrivibrio sp. AE3004]
MIGKQFKSLKNGAKRVFIGLVVICLVSTSTGIGSMFASADEYEEHLHNISATDNGDGTHTITCGVEGCRDYPKTEAHTYNSENVCLVCGSVMDVTQADEYSDSLLSDNNEEFQNRRINPFDEEGNEDALDPENEEFERGMDPRNNEEDPFDPNSEENTNTEGLIPDPSDTEEEADEPSTDINSLYPLGEDAPIISLPDALAADLLKFTAAEGVSINSSGDIDYAESSFGFTSDPFSISFNDTMLTEGTDYTTDVDKLSIPSIPEVGSEYTITYTGSGNFTGTITKKIVVSDVTMYYNGVKEKESSYAGKVELSADGYEISLSEDGSYTSSLIYTEAGMTSPTVYLQNSTTGKKVKLIASAIEIGDHAFTEFFDEPLEVATGLIYNTEPQLILKNIADPAVGTTGVDSVKRITDLQSFYFTDAGIDLNVTYEIEYTSGTDTKKLSKDFTTSISPRELSDEDITVSIDENVLYLGNINYEKVTNYSDIISVTYKRPSGDTYKLEEGKDYDIEVPDIPNPAAASTDDSYKLRIKGKGNFTGVLEKDVVVPPLEVTYNNEAVKKDLYVQSVVINPVDLNYTISTDPGAAFKNFVNYDKKGKNQEVVLYFKNKETGKTIMQKLQDVSIIYPELLYDGKPTMSSYYEGSVNLRADDFKVTRVEETNGTITKVQAEYYIRKVIGTNQSFTIYFMDASGIDTVTEIPIKVTGLDIYIGTDIGVLYNGGSYKEWFNTDVEITAPGYMLSIHGRDDYAKSLKITNEGKNSLSVDFKNSTTVKNYQLNINIDKQAPTGKIVVDKYTSKKFRKKDETAFCTAKEKTIKISLEDELSGKDYIKYYISDKFYSSLAELKTATANDTTAWKTYSSKNKPVITVDKKNYIYALLYDKAGNETPISTGAIIYDTEKPVVVSALITKDKEGKRVAALGGTDELSGIDYFILFYREKDKEDISKQYDVPTKEDVMKTGIRIKVTDSKDNAYIAAYVLNDLDKTKEYDFFVMAVDKVENTSEIFKAEVDKKVTEEIKEEAKKAEGKDKSEGLTPAPNGIAGGGGGDAGKGTGEGGAGSGSGAGAGAGAGAGSGGDGSKSSGGQGKENGKGTDDKSSSSGTSGSAKDIIAEKEISREPYILNATGSTKIGPIETSGWKNISSEIVKADIGSIIEIEMSGMSTIPQTYLQNLAGRKDLVTRYEMADDVKWEIRGGDIHTDTLRDMDMGVILGSKNIPATVLSEVVSVYPHVEFSTKSSGDLGFDATISIPVGESYSGMNATLYYYNEETKELVKDVDTLVSGDGYARFPLSHLSDYTVVISQGKIVDEVEAGEGVGTGTSDTISAIDEPMQQEIVGSNNVRLNDVLSISGSETTWLFIIAFISAVLCIGILLVPGFKETKY